jgi:hypothetical protein
MSHMRSRSSNITVVQSVTPALRGGETAGRSASQKIVRLLNSAVEDQKIAKGKSILIHTCNRIKKQMVTALKISAGNSHSDPSLRSAFRQETPAWLKTQILRLATLAQDFGRRLPLTLRQAQGSLTPPDRLNLKPAPILPRDFQRRL